ncbi:MAG: apolipoprotein N-acyltransferase [Nitrospiraceae bacterium]|nr:MAG: apolipoprotein N-acyltransferase [Nitrospiraceae bacterium]
MIKKSDIFLSLISGGMLIFSFPPFDIYPLAWFGLIPLLIALWGKNTKTSFFLGMIAGFVYFLGTVYWVFHSMYFYGYIAAPLSILILVLLCLYLSLFAGAFSALFLFIARSSRVPSMIIAPAVWVTLEYLRTYAFTGFPWASLGYSQYRFLPLIQIADTTGIYGVSFLVVATNSVIFDAVISWPRRMRQEPLFPRWLLTFSIIIYGAVMAVVLLYGFGKLGDITTGENIKISVVQGNIPQDKKWDARFQREVIDTYKRLSLSVSSASPGMIVWPETAVPFIFGDDASLSQEITALPGQLNTYLLFGAMVAKDTARLSNSAVLLSPGGKVLSMYDKIHLVPYGEYVPLRNFFPFIEKITVGIGDFLPGKEYAVMETPFAKIGNLICYEIIFPGLVRNFVDRGANVLVTITNDAWFGRTAAPYQHFSMAVFRAVENRVPVVRAANTGISGFIDSRGRILNKSDIFVEAAMTEKIVPGNERSSYTTYGDLFAYWCVIGTVVLIMKRLFLKK